MATSIVWQGLPDLLRRFDRSLDLTDTLYQEASKAWGDRVVGQVRGQQASSRMAGSVRAEASKRTVEVTLGRPGLPFVGWMEFGGPRFGGSRRGRRQAAQRAFGGAANAPRPYVVGGRSLYPTLGRMRPEGLNAFREKTNKTLDWLGGR